MSVPFPLRVRDPQAGDPPIPVQVVRRILVGHAVLVFVPGPDAAPEELVLDQRQVRAVGIELGTHVEGIPLQEIRHLRVPTVAGEEMAHGVEGHLGGRELSGVDAAIQVEGRLLPGGPRDLRCHLHHPEVSALQTLADGVELGELREELVVFLEDPLRLPGSVVAVPVHRAVGLHQGGLLPCEARRKEQKEQNEEEERG